MSRTVFSTEMVNLCHPKKTCDGNDTGCAEPTKVLARTALLLEIRNVGLHLNFTAIQASLWIRYDSIPSCDRAGATRRDRYELKLQPCPRERIEDLDFSPLIGIKPAQRRPLLY